MAAKLCHKQGQYDAVEHKRVFTGGQKDMTGESKTSQSPSGANCNVSCCTTIAILCRVTIFISEVLCEKYSHEFTMKWLKYHLIEHGAREIYDEIRPGTGDVAFFSTLQLQIPILIVNRPSCSYNQFEAGAIPTVGMNSRTLSRGITEQLGAVQLRIGNT
ncbi:hypothetical protein NQ315_002833 [Exocentrus adspersus]|uniref:Uncharacterized protein n=1 Tax=Exocentrus adspersus TaxID=1586481 RepID=A0AAV8VIQ3_9CUCU|nr:hypothetical protein NQ315_002833 [Exocentrus adspersus]